MNRRDELLVLASKVEALDGPDREVDAEIAVSIHGGEIVWLQANYTMENYPARKYASADHVGGYGKAPVDPVTASLDAAMSLVPEKWDFAVASEEGKGVAGAIRRKPHAHADAEAATPALALTAAALRALAEQKQ
jgi:hypothetical protein